MLKLLFSNSLQQLLRVKMRSRETKRAAVRTAAKKKRLNLLEALTEVRTAFLLETLNVLF
jgi:hypothetical protein